MDYDLMTGFFKLTRFKEELLQILRRAAFDKQPVSVLMMDMDHFKNYNDDLKAQHAAGDEAIKILADILRQNKRPADFPSRYGGEEFALILPNTTSKQAYEAAERLRRQIESKMRSSMKKAFPNESKAIDTLDGTISIGVSTMEAPDLNQEPDRNIVNTLVSKADTALKAAKNAGRNRVMIFSEPASVSAHETPVALELANDEQEAVEAIADLQGPAKDPGQKFDIEGQDLETLLAIKRAVDSAVERKLAQRQESAEKPIQSPKD